MPSRSAIGFVAALVLLLGGAAYARHELRATYARHLPPAAAAPAPGTSALDRVMKRQEREALTSAIATLALVDYADALPAKRRLSLARRSCATLTSREPLTVALRATCRPVLDLIKVSEAAKRGCERWRRCVHLMHKRSDALYAGAIAERRLARAVRRTLPAGPCRAALAPSGRVVRADLANSVATRRLGDAIAADDDDWYDTEHQRMHAAARIYDRELVYPRRRSIAKACNLPVWAFDAR